MFNTDNMTVDPENCAHVLLVYLSGLTDCAQRTSAYFLLATHLCTVARKYPPLRELIQPFLKTLTPIFGDLVLQDMQLYRPESDWRDLARFRGLASEFYGELVPAFVWLQKISEVVINVDVLLSFLLVQLKSRRERWIKDGAFDALPILLKAFGENISLEMLELAVRVSREYVNEATLVDAAELLKDGKEYNILRELIFAFVAKPGRIEYVIVGILLKGDHHRTLKKYAFGLFVMMLKNWNDQRTIAVLTILFDHTPEVIGKAIDITLAQQNLPVEFQLQVVTKGLLFSRGELPLVSISRFVIENFKQGAMHMVGRILVEREEIGLALIADGAGKAAFLLAAIETANARAYLRYIQLCLSIVQKFPRMRRQFAASVIRLSICAAAKHGGEKVHYAKQIVSQCVSLFRDALQVLGEEFCATIWESLPSEEKEKTIVFVSAGIRAAEQKKKAENLVLFSTNERPGRQDEWQSVEIVE
jgi:hypothetical protein